MLIELFVGAKWGGSWGERRKRWVYENNESNLTVQQSTSSLMKAAFIQIYPGYFEENYVAILLLK